MSSTKYTKEQLLAIRDNMSQDIRKHKFLNSPEYKQYLQAVMIQPVRTTSNPQPKLRRSDSMNWRSKSNE